MDYKDEINRHYALEYGEGSELVVRLVGALGGAALLYLYTGWNAALVWGAGFAGTNLVYYLFLKSRIQREPDRISRSDNLLSSGLFLMVLISFLWMPTLLISQQDKALTVVGACLVGCVLVILVRRSDTLRVLIAGEIAVVGVAIGTAIAVLIPAFDDTVARVGVALSAAALLWYFARTLLFVRRQRLMAEDSARRASQVQKMAAVGQLAGGVAHDFNNKLTAILGSFDLLAEIEDPAEREAILDGARSVAVDAARTVKHLMVYARKEPMQIAVLECADLLDEVVRRARGVITGTIRIDLRSTNQPPMVLADREQLLMALINLVVNAVDAMPEGGSLVLGAEAVSLSAPVALADGTFLTAGPNVAIFVEDTGLGIPARILPQVVEPFFTTKPVGKGAGLGLSAVLGLARELRGGLGITSTSAGTRVTIYLPRQPGD